MKVILILTLWLTIAYTHAEVPRNRHGLPVRQLILPQKLSTQLSESYLPPQFQHQEFASQLPEEYGVPNDQYGPPLLEKIITKNVYVHVPPEQPTEIIQSAQVQEPLPPKKHYKIIFIKAPYQEAPPAAPPVQQQDEHKTLVYVLVKKPEAQQQIILPTAEPTEPSKPEVFFIKYKDTKKPALQYGPPAPY